METERSEDFYQYLIIFDTYKDRILQILCNRKIFLSNILANASGPNFTFFFVTELQKIFINIQFFY